MTVLTSAKLQKLEKASDGVTAVVDIKGKSQSLKAERVIMAIGIVGNSEI